MNGVVFKFMEIVRDTKNRKLNLRHTGKICEKIFEENLRLKLAISAVNPQDV